MESEFYKTRVFKAEQYTEVIHLKTGLILAHDDTTTLLLNPKTSGTVEHAYMGPVVMMVVSPDHRVCALYTQETMPGQADVQHWIHRETLLTLDPALEQGLPALMHSIRLDKSVTSLSVDNKGNVTILIENNEQEQGTTLKLYRPDERATA